MLNEEVAIALIIHVTGLTTKEVQQLEAKIRGNQAE